MEVRHVWSWCHRLIMHYLIMMIGAGCTTSGWHACANPLAPWDLFVSCSMSIMSSLQGCISYVSLVSESNLSWFFYYAPDYQAEPYRLFGGYRSPLPYYVNNLRCLVAVYINIEILSQVWRAIVDSTGPYYYLSSPTWSSSATTRLSKLPSNTAGPRVGDWYLGWQIKPQPFTSF